MSDNLRILAMNNLIIKLMNEIVEMEMRALQLVEVNKVLTARLGEIEGEDKPPQRMKH